MTKQDKYIDYLFEDQDSGELFFVEIKKTTEKSYTTCYNEAWEIAKENFEEPELITKMSPELAETYGYDTY